MTVVNISIGVDNKAEITYLRFRSDFKNAGVGVPVRAGEKRRKTSWRGGSQIRFLTCSWMSCSLLAVAKNRLVSGCRGAPARPACASMGVCAHRTPRRGELT
ncbi:hypothetical protein HPG69_016568 [Diceros bicornis minor]|uniref:Uncharacterized protein n=1 Tax=Diceros bicornis minor TaxID=77932 RepID=A0A7J7EYE2_DICBM|nr:hypothetical protein HPG69_016568 [Diceros bicornis minor]